MKTEGWSGRILFLLVLCLVGVSAYDWRIALLGLAVGLVAIAIEARFVRLPMVEIVYTTIGAAAGVGLGILAMLMLHLGNIRPGREEAADPLLMIPLALGYAFSQVALAKARKPGQAGREAVTEAARSSVLVDESAIVDGRIADMVLIGLLSGPFVVPSSARPAFELQLKSRDIVQRGRARRGLETLERLEEAAGRSGGIQDRDFGDPDRERLRMLDWLKRESATLVSADPAFLDMASREGSRVIRLDEVGAATRSVILPGEKLRMKPIKRGRNQGQAVGYLADGTMVVVEDGEEHINRNIEAVAHTTFRASGGTMVFARVTGGEDEPREEPVQNGEDEDVLEDDPY